MNSQKFSGPKPLKVCPKKILIIGTMGSGKTTLAKILARDNGFPYASIDDCRIRYGDGTVFGEDHAWENFLTLCHRSTPGVLEFCGMGPHAEEVRDNLLGSTLPVLVVWIVLPLDICLTRAMDRQKNIPFPFPWGPVEFSVPAIHRATGLAWDTVWSREPRFHATRLEFSGSASVAEMYTAIRKVCLPS